MRSILIPLAICVCLSACATVDSGGFKLAKREADEAFELVRSRAAFDLDCPRDELQLTALAVVEALGSDYAKQIGVEGCGQRAAYVKVDGGWVLNGDSMPRRLDPPE